MAVLLISGLAAAIGAAKSPEAAEPAKASEAAITSGAVASAASCASTALIAVAFRSFLHNLLVSLLYFLKPLLRLILVRIIDICVRMIFPAQGLICFFYILFRCASGNAQDLIRVTHVLPPAGRRLSHPVPLPAFV